MSLRFPLITAICKECRIDAALRETPENPQGSFHPDYSDVESENLDSDMEEVQSLSMENLSSETLLAAYFSIARSWDEASAIAGQRVPTLRNIVTHSRVLRVENLLPLDIFGLSTYATSGLRFSSLAIL